MLQNYFPLFIFVTKEGKENFGDDIKKKITTCLTTVF